VWKKAIFLPVMLVAIAYFCAVTAGSSAAPQRIDQSQQQREMEDRQQKEANKKRQDDIRGETDKLFQLATELKAAVDKSNEHVLSLDVVKKAEEVEKLAKKIKDKMKEGIGKPSIGEPQPPPNPFPRPPR
jgi:hypothetical protein